MPDDAIDALPAPLVHHLFAHAAATHAAQVAVVFGAESLTYQQLNDQANALSHRLRRADPGAELVGLSTTRGLAMVVGLLAILKAGKAYLPLDPSYPTQRLHQLVGSARLATCLAPATEAALFAGLGLRVVAEKEEELINKSPTTSPSQSELAYVLFTSGSTGAPKGVCMGHRPLANLLAWQQRHSAATTGTRTLQFAPLSFDVSFQEILATLSTGGTLVLVADDLRLDFTRLLQFIDNQRINRLFLPFVALQYLAEVAVSTQQFPASLAEVMTAGEQLKITPQLAAFFTALPGCVLHNQYGPTECHVVTQLTLTGPPATWPALPTIGQAIDNVALFIIDDALQPVPAGEVGELCLGGACLAAGYLHQPALTAEKFISWPGPDGRPARVYRTGDLARRLPDGTVEFLGRRDDQVKIRGHRVELGEVEAALNAVPGIQQAVVVARAPGEGPQQLVAYLVASAPAPDVTAVYRALEKTLPDYLRPSAFVWLADFPKTTSGKVDKQALPPPATQRPTLGAAYRKPTTPTERNIAQVWAELLRLDQVGLDDNFFELGGHSLLAQKTVAALHGRFGYHLPITKLYQFPTVAGLGRYLAPTDAKPASAPLAAGGRPTEPAGDVAIIGMAGRFPGATTPDELWEVLRDGRETTRFFAADELDAAIPAALKNDPRYVRARGLIDHADQFDAAFFGLNPKLASVMDPQQRVFLEIAWEALEQTGYLPQQRPGATVGVYAGSGNNTYYLRNVQQRPDIIEQVGEFQAMTANEKDYLASRTAYQLNLTGPAVGVYAACSTALLAVAQAVESLRSGQCDVALAGGVSITAPLRSGHLYQEGAMFSPDGHCRPFDADARGTVFSDGAGVVLLKSLAAAQRDGDPIYAVIKGVGVTNDGGSKGSFTAPSAVGQAGAIARALADAQVAPATISYVEAHGTATPLGDPIEVEGLTLAFGEQATRQFCALGSIKSNMGHLTAAAGAAGLIKTVLALRHQQLPPSLGFAKPNPHIDFANSPFFVNTALTDWPVGPGPRRAGVSAFGVGGTNVHVVVEEYTAPAPAAGPLPRRPAELVVWSAKSATSREAYAGRLAHCLAQPGAPTLADAAFTLPITRPAFQHRRFAVAASSAELVAQLRAEAGARSPATGAHSLTEAPGDVFFLFPGQGAQYLGMGRELYEAEPTYRAAVDECATLLASHLPTDIRTILYADPPDPAAEARLRDTRYAQPALFVTEYALAHLWLSWGIVPTGFCGHSIGEFVAAHLAGVFSLADALALVAIRGRLVSALPPGSMLSVRLTEECLVACLPTTLAVAAANGPSLYVVAGPTAEVAAFAQLLDTQGTPNRLLATSHAFHSAMMEPVVAEFEQAVAAVPLHRPRKPLVSTVSGTWLTDAQATDPYYWATHLRQPVRFAAALDTLLAQQPLLLEVGPGHVLASLAHPLLAGKAGAAIASLKKTVGPHPEYQALLAALGQLWARGVAPDWAAYYAGQSRQLAKLPTYAFDRQPCWLAPAGPPAPAEPTPAPALSFSLPPRTMRKSLLLTATKAVLEDASGIEMHSAAPDLTFLEMGFDSLLLTQVAITLKKKFGVPITFRQLNEDYATLDHLTAYLDQALPADAYQPAAAPPVPPAPAPAGAPMALPTSGDSALGLIAQQLQLLARQVALLQGSAPAAPIATGPLPAAVAPAPVAGGAPLLTPEEALEIKKPFGASPRIERHTSQLSASQQDFLQRLTARYTQKTRASKAYTQQHRPHMADPRVVSGFRPLTKELVYPLVVDHSKGSRLWDLDGNEYIDALNGFGSSMFGHQPTFITEALHAQIERGYEVGPQHPLAGEVSQLLCEFTGFERAALCNTGSEAVLGAMRIARTVTGRSLIVAFAGSYHGIIDEVLVRGTKALKSFPAAPGIMPEAVQNMLILDYGTDESLRILAERAHELAAVLVEPVQSRRPEFQPVAFLQQVRTLTAAAGTALIFDEVITGFRLHPGGAQALFGVRADLATYGKVIGGGLSIGAIAGTKDFMDALDGGAWQFGDVSGPEVGVTYFAGTFVRHPLALAAAKASLLHMQAQGPTLQKQLTASAGYLATALNAGFEQQQLPFFIAQFGSLWKIKFREEIPYGELLFTLLREKGLHIWDGFPCFMTTAHTEQEVKLMVALIQESVQEMLEAGFFKGSLPHVTNLKNNTLSTLNQPPVPGAKLGRDRHGNPAWFIADPNHTGDYLKFELQS